MRNSDCKDRASKRNALRDDSRLSRHACYLGLCALVALMFGACAPRTKTQTKLVEIPAASGNAVPLNPASTSSTPTTGTTTNSPGAGSVSSPPATGPAPTSPPPATTPPPGTGTPTPPGGATSPPSTPGTGGPTITSIAPLQGSRGDTIVIDGSGFAANPQDNTVRFNGEYAQVSAASTGSLRAVVPDMAQSGDVTVTVGNRHSNGLAFSVLDPRPVIHAVDPTYTTSETTQITLTGINLGNSPQVSIGGQTVNIISSSATSITTTLPAYFGSSPQGGAVEVKTTNGRSNTFGLSHLGDLAILGVLPSSANPGDRIEIAVLDSSVGATVLFTDERNQDVTAQVVGSSGGRPGKLQVVVPAGAVSGSVQLQGTGGRSNVFPFRIQGPSVSVSPIRQANSSTPHPWTSGGSRTQVLLHADEIGRAGEVIGLAWEMGRSNFGLSVAATIRNCEIRLGHSSLSELGTDFATNHDIGAPVSLMRADYMVPDDRTGFMALPLSATFSYNGKDNLVLEITHDGATASNAWKHGPCAGKRRLTASSATATTGTTDAVLHGVRLVFARTRQAGGTDASLATVVTAGTAGEDLLGTSPFRAMLKYSPYELGYHAGGVIRAISLRCAGPAVAATYRNLTIRLVHDSPWSLYGSFSSLGNLPVTVAKIPSLTVSGGERWIRIPLSNSFVFHNRLPLVIEITGDGGSAIQRLECGPSGGYHRLLSWTSTTATAGESQDRSYGLRLEME